MSRTYEVVVEHDLEMRASDGTILRADVYRPDAPGTFPVLLTRTAYDKTVRLRPDGLWAIHVSETHFFPQHGYVVVAQDTRGRFASEGDFYPFLHEGRDGYDAVEWAARLPWSNGVVGMCGQSYQGIVQYMAAAERPPSLRAASPVSAPVTHFRDCVYHDGVFELGWMLAYFMGLGRHTIARKGLAEQLDPVLDAWLEDPSVRFSPLTQEAYRHLPVRDWGERLRDVAPFLAELMEHDVDGPFWEAMDVRPRVSQIDIPMLHVSSWYDTFLPDTLAIYEGVRDHGATPQARAGQRLLLGPWAHIPYAHPTSGGTGDADFGPEALIELHELQLRWFDHHLKGIDNGVMEGPPVRLFTMGDNRWRDEPAWPTPRATPTPLYLRADGRLSAEAPADEPPDTFDYDPQDPVPTRGGNTLFALGMAGGVFDQSEIEARDDVLVYTGEVLEAPLEVTGPVRVRLHVSTSAPDTDFTAKLVDVRPDGYAANVVDGVVRLRFRESFRQPTLVEPGSVVAVDVDLWATSHVFQAGHRVRLEVSSSNFPRWERNPNTGHAFGVDGPGDLRVAHQQVFHDELRPSHVLLPVAAG